MTRCVLLAAVVLAGVALESRAADVGALIGQIKAVGKEGKGNVAAAKAWRELVQEGSEALPAILTALDEASPVAANWLRGAVDAIAERAHKNGNLPTAELEKFVRDTTHAGHARRLAFEWLGRADASLRARLLSDMVADPGAELRREAIEVQLKKHQDDLKSAPKQALSFYESMLKVARDHDQVKLIAERIENLGVAVDLTTQLGFVTRWALVGPFDNVKGVGFHTAYPPERGVDLKATYQGKDGKKFGWFEHGAEKPAKASDLRKLGLVDLNKLFQNDADGTAERVREATVYGYSVVESATERPVEIRAGSNNAIRIWLSGKEVFFREEYHHGVEIDQHVGRGTLRAGRNEVLIKVCQNHQDEAWARQWSFQLRICDAIGGAVPVTVVTEKLPTKPGGE